MLKLTRLLPSSLPSPQRPAHFRQPEVVHQGLPAETVGVAIQMSAQSEMMFYQSSGPEAQRSITCSVP